MRHPDCRVLSILLAWVLHLIGCMYLFDERIACAQSVEVPPVRTDDAPAGPYRRVYVRDTDLPVEGYRAMELESFQSLIEDREKRIADLDPNSPDRDTELLAFHAQVRLVGADLVSDRSRFRWNWDRTNARNRNGVRKLIAPWTPAIDFPQRLGTSPSPNTLVAPTWMYDSSGQPMVRVNSNEEWFSWTLRPLSTSTPNRLNYAPSFPLTIDGCLVLQLPKSFRIVDASTVVRRLENWTQVTERIGDWSAAQVAADSIPELNSTDAFWLVELSGRDQASFSILLNPSRDIYEAIGGALGADDRTNPAWNRLIAKQTVAHTVTSHHVKTSCDWEWQETTALDRTFRIRVPEGVRLRQIKLNDRETSPRFVDRMLELVMPVEEIGVAGSAGAGTRMRVSAEFLATLSELDSDSNGEVRVPPIGCLNAYVVAGTTSLASEKSIAIRNIRSGTGRLETIRNSDKLLDRLDFSWFQSPPELSFAVAERAPIDSAEILTRLSTDSNRLVAVAKMQLSPWHATAPNRIEIESGWSVDTMQINHPGLGLAVEEPGPVANATLLRIDPNGPVDDGPIQIELQLSRSGNASSDESFPSSRIVALPGRKSSQTLVIEPGYASRLEYLGDFSEDLCKEETLTPWQRDRLPRLGRFLLFQMPDGRLPKLRWKEDPPRFDCAISTTLKDEDDRLRVEHVLEFNHGTTAPENVTIQLPGSWRWEWESSQGWKPFPAKVGSEGDSWFLGYPPPSFSGTPDSEPTGRWRFRAIAIRERGKEAWQIPFPRLIDDQPTTYSLRADSIFQVLPDQQRHVWKFDSEGELVLHWRDPVPDAAPVKITVKALDQGEPNRWWITRSDLHVAVDFHGQQRAVLELDSQGLRSSPWEFGLKVPEGWSLERVVDVNSDRNFAHAQYAFTFRRDGDRYWIDSHTTSKRDEPLDSEIRLVLSGPKLEHHSMLNGWIMPTSGLAFSWPAIELDPTYPKPTRTLWTPDSVLLASAPDTDLDWRRGGETSAPGIARLWSVWRWTAEAASWLGWDSVDRSENIATVSMRAASMPPSELIPPWIATDWSRSVSTEDPAAQRGLATERLTLRSRTLHTGPALWLVIAILIAYALLQRAPWWCLAIAVAATVGGHWFPDSIAIWFRSTWVGFAVGALLYMIRWTVTATTGIRPADRLDRPETWQPWNEPGLSDDGLTDSTNRAAVITSLSLILSLAIGLPMVAQDVISSSRGLGDTPFDVLIPLAEDGSPFGSIVYVPETIATGVESRPSVSPSPDRDSYLISARHSLRFDARSISFGNTEQSCIHTYDIWIGETGVGRAWRIPFSTDRSRLSRYMIDGVEAPSSRLAKNDNELIWYPDRPGRRTLQIESQVRIRPSERDRNDSNPLETGTVDLRAPRAWSVDVPILPAGNAFLDVETDAGWSVDFNRRGRFSNPSIGKFSIQLGNQDRLAGDIAPEVAVTPSGVGIVGSEPGALGNSDMPEMTTELFIDRDQLLARTILEYPRAVDAPEEIELESDMQWQPVGNLWGEAKLIDVRPGSTLDRRRYIVRWTPDASSSTGKRVIATTWIPVGTVNLRNVLFAECRDRRVRPNTLRYARTAGSIWMLEGINTWVPSINTKERIEWVELNERPIATSLRIPINGGFGVLRQQAESKLQRARVSHQLGLGPSKLSVRSRIEFSNPINNRRNLILSVPARYAVTEVLSRNRPLAHTEWLVGEHRMIQVFIDREIGDVNDLVLLSEQDLSGIDSHSAVLPFLTMDGISIAEQFAEISADPAWRVRFAAPTAKSDFTILRGRGLGQSLTTMSLNESNASDPILLDRMKGKWVGNLSARIVSVSEDELRWQLRMIGHPAADAKPMLAVSLPADMARDWKSDSMIQELPSMDSTRRWMQIQPVWDNERSEATFTVDWIADPKAFRDSKWLEQVRFESDPGLVCTLDRDSETDMFFDRDIVQSEQSASPDSSMSRDGKSHEEFELHRIRSTPSNRGRQGILSSWWVDLAAWPSDGRSSLEWRLPSSTHVDWVTLNGEGVYWFLDEDRLSIAIPPVRVPVRIDVWTDRDGSEEFVSSVASIPTLVRDAGVRPRGWIIADGQICSLDGQRTVDQMEIGRELRRTVCQRNLDVVAGLHQAWPDRERTIADGGGVWFRWTEKILLDVKAMLMAWVSDTATPDSSDYEEIVSSYMESATRLDPDRRWSRVWNHAGPIAGNRIDPLLDRIVAGRAPIRGVVRQGDSFWGRLLATLGMGLMVVLAPWVWRAVVKPMQRRAWWPLAAIGVGIWVLAGTWIPALVLTFLGLLVAIDSYWILNERFRQTGTRAPR